MQLNEQVIRNFAHQIWESEGKPEGQAQRHWEMACKLAEGESGPADPLEPLSIPGKTQKRKTTKIPAKEQDAPVAAGPFGPAEHEVTMAVAEPTIAPPPTRVRVKAILDGDGTTPAPKKRATKAEKPSKTH